MLFLLLTAAAIVWVRNLFAVVILSGVYSLLMAGTFTILDAVDVAFTEAAVGAGISTVLLLATLALVGQEDPGQHRRALGPIAIVALAGAMLIYAVPDMPRFGSPEAPIHVHVAPRYIEETPNAIGIPNVVTAVLADYRSFDTLGEVTVIFTAGIGVLLLLAGKRRKRK
ncbi:MAG: DUF4040 domain-containing protein [Alphaproteobacteria bacterium]